MSSSEIITKRVLATTVAATTSRRRISPRSLSKCQTERARKAKLISKSLFGISNKAELREWVKKVQSHQKLINLSSYRHAKATGSDVKKSQWEFDFENGKPAKVMKQYKWEALPKDEVPHMYHVNHIKRLRSSAQNAGFEGQLPKLRYYHHIKKVDPQEEENNNKPVSIKTQPITASAKKNGSAGQLKITGIISIFSNIDFYLHWRFFISFQIFSKRKSGWRWQREKSNDRILSRISSLGTL